MAERRNKITTNIEKNLRLAAYRRGYLMIKRRIQMNCPGVGKGYMLIDQYTGEIVAGKKFDLTMDGVKDYLNNNPCSYE